MESCQMNKLRKCECLNGSSASHILHLNKAWQITLLRPHFSLCQLNVGNISKRQRMGVVSKILQPLIYSELYVSLSKQLSMVPVGNLREINLHLKD